MSSRGSSEQYISELEEQLQELLEKNEELEKKIQQQDKDNEVLKDRLVSAQKSGEWAEGEKEELVAQLAKKEAERREAVGVQVLEKDEYTREIEGLHETLDGLRVEYSQKLEFMNARCSKHAGRLLAANAKLEEKTREVKELRAQLGVSPQEPPADEEERKKSWATDFSTDFGGPVAFGGSATHTLADELGDEFSSEPGSPPSSSRPHSPASAASPSSSRPHSPTSAAASPAPSAPYDSDDGSNATGVTYDDDNRPDDTDDGSHATGLTHDDDHDTSSHPDDTVEHEDAQIEQDEPIAEQNEPEVQENEPEIQEDEPAEEQEPTEEEQLATEDQPTEDETAVDENEQGLTTTTEVDLTDDELGFTGSEFAEDDSTELQDQPAAAASPYGPLKSLLMQERPLVFDDHNPYEEAFRPASPVYGQPDSDAAGPSDALQAVQMFPQERAARNNLAREIQEEKTKLNAAVADLQQEKADEVKAIKDSMNDYLEEIDARRVQELEDADLRRVQDLEAADARRLTDLHEAQSKIIGMWKAFAERIRPMLQYSAVLEAIIRQQGIDVSFLEHRRPDAKKTEDELNEMASRNDLVVSPMRLAVDIPHPKELIADIPSIRISPPSEESSPTTTAPPPNSPTSEPTTSPTSPTSTTAAAAYAAACSRLHVYLWPLLAFLFTLLTLFWFAGLSEAERKLWDDANDGARLSTLGHFGYGGRLSYRLFTPVSRTLYSDGGYLPDDGQQVWMHPLVRISAALVEPVFASVQVVVAGFAVVLGCLVGMR